MELQSRNKKRQKENHQNYTKTSTRKSRMASTPGHLCQLLSVIKKLTHHTQNIYKNACLLGNLEAVKQIKQLSERCRRR